MFRTRWRWVAARALTLLRFSGGRKVPPPLQRMRSDDLLAAIFPEQTAYLENIQGDIVVPDHPLVQETLTDCLTEALDIEGLVRIIQKIESIAIRCQAVDTREPSPFSHEILNANAYAFLDDAPLEERRARAVQVRRTLPDQAADLGVLDVEAIEQVSREAWPPMENADELHDAFLTLGVVEETPRLEHLFEQLVQQNRARRLFLVSGDGKTDTTNPAMFWFATERLRLIEMVYPEGRIIPQLSVTPDCLWQKDQVLKREKAVREIVGCHMECTGPVTADELSERLHISLKAVKAAQLDLEKEGLILRGSFRAGVQQLEWCNRRLLARIHRLTLGRLRREIEPVTPDLFLRFLFRWQHVASGTQMFWNNCKDLKLLPHHGNPPSYQAVCRITAPIFWINFVFRVKSPGPG